MDKPEAVAAEGSAQAPLVVVEGITKSFGGVRALRGVNLEVRPGEVHALLGENGAGKSTLIKILSGVHSYDGGTIHIAGRPVTFNTPAKSREAGIAVVYQDLSLVESLSVGANLLLGREPRGPFGFLKKKRLMMQAKEFLQQYGIQIDPRVSVDSLPFAYRQMTEIAKALIGEVRLLVLDEPTSSLTADETQILFDAVRRVTDRGVGVIYVTHRLNEVFQISQRVTVFRDGANVGTFVTAETDMKRLVAAIVGPGHTAMLDTSKTAAPVRIPAIGAPALSLSGVTNDRLDAVDITVHKGEIHGLAGLIGSGRTEILETIFGIRATLGGTITIDGTVRRLNNPAQAIEEGIALVPEDRHAQGLVLEHSIERNITLARLRDLSRWGWMQQGAAVQSAQAAIRQLSVKAPGPASPVKSLSGGNQQKVVFAKWNMRHPRLLLLDEPTVGVDVGAREEIYGVIRDAARQGTGVLVVSSDLVELLLLCDRISLVVDGRIVAAFACNEIGDAEDLHHRIQVAQTAHERNVAELSA